MQPARLPAAPSLRPAPRALLVSFKMAAPRGDLLKDLNAGFTEFPAPEAPRDTQDELDGGRSLGFGHDVDSTSSTLHGILEPSILSIFNDTSSAGEVKNRIDEESEATLLSALSEILDSVIEETLSPFDTLPDSELFVGQRNLDSKFRRSSDKDSAPRATRSQRSSLSSTKIFHYSLTELYISSTSLYLHPVSISSTSLYLHPVSISSTSLYLHPVSISSTSLYLHPVSISSTSLYLHPVSISSTSLYLHPVSISSTDRTGHSAEVLLSDRQLRPRLHQRIQTATVQRSDGEEEELSESRRRPVRTFRIESDPELSQDEQQDGHVLVSLVDLVRHMHPYSLRVGLGKEDRVRDVCELQEEDVFVDVVGDDDLEDDTLLGSPEQKPPPPQTPAAVPKGGTGVDEEISGAGSKEDTCSPSKEPQRSVLATVGGAGRVKKKVSFAPDLASVHEYQAEDEASERDWPDAPAAGEPEPAGCDYGTAASGENFTGVSADTPSKSGKAKPRSISLQEYRLLRGKTLPKEERRMDYRTKWPSVPEAPCELPPIPCIPGYSPPQVNVNTSFAGARMSTPGSPAKPRRHVPMPCKSPPKQLHAVDPPNPVVVPLPTPVPSPAKTSPSPEDQDAMQQKSAVTSQPSPLNPQPPSTASQTSENRNSLNQETPSPHAEVPQASQCPAANTSAPSLPTSGRVAPQRRLPLVQIPTNVRDRHRPEEPGQEARGEIGNTRIQAADVTSLLEQFETQGLTPPATPPHQIWKPLVPGHRPKQHEAIKPSPSKAIQIIEPRPLPPSKVHLKPQPSTPVPAPSLFLAFRDHDYCGTREVPSSRDKSPRGPRSQASHKSLDHRTFCQEEHLPGSVLLSPESSPCRQEDSSAGGAEDTEDRSSCSPSPSARGRTRRRRYRGSHHRSDSSSASSSRSSSCSSTASSSSSRSPPRKRRRSRRSRSSSSSSSSRSSSSSLSPSPIRKRQRRYNRSSRSYSRSCSGSRSPSRSRSRSHSPQLKLSRWRRHREHYRRSRWEEAHRVRKQKAIEERRVVYVGRIRGTMTEDELRDRFSLFGRIEDCTVHFRSHGDNYGFVTYYNTDDAFAAIENGVKLRQPDELPFDICFGGRRQFCQSNYADLDSNRDVDSTTVRQRCDALDFDTLLKQAQRGVKR
ncbi:hypothetical protein NFI96_024525 [Prochilodus magdalenae]|nr:hypothetical protein NFI96_024525 [Prochilodus magdalenae]